MHHNSAASTEHTPRSVKVLQKFKNAMNEAFGKDYQFPATRVNDVQAKSVDTYALKKLRGAHNFQTGQIDSIYKCYPHKP